MTKMPLNFVLEGKDGRQSHGQVADEVGEVVQEPLQEEKSFV